MCVVDALSIFSRSEVYMPNSDGSGPAGAGKKTGKGLGPCAGDPVKAPVRGQRHGVKNGLGHGHGQGNKGAAAPSPKDGKNSDGDEVKQA